MELVQSASAGPATPFAAWPLQLSLPAHGFYWYARPAAVVCQTTFAQATVSAVDAHNDVLDGVLSVCAGEIAEAGGLLIFDDWRSIRGFEPGARSRMQQRMAARKRGYARRTVVVVHPSNRLLRMALEAASLFKTLTFGARIEVALSAELALEEARLTPPRLGETFPAR